MTEDVRLFGKVGTFPGQIKDLAVKPGTTVSEALRLAGFSVGQGQTLKLNGARLSLDNLDGAHIEEDGFAVIITGQVNGNRGG